MAEASQRVNLKLVTEFWIRRTAFGLGWLPLLPLCAAGCAPAQALLLCDDPLYETSTAAPRVRLPQDEAPHCYGGAEWWYYSGLLYAPDGQRFGMHAVMFHFPRLPLVHVGDLWVSHYALLDVHTGRLVYDQSVALGPATGRPAGGFNLDRGLVRLRGSGGRDRLEASLSSGDFALALDLVDARGAVLHGGDGYVPFGDGARSFYYSRPRMAAEGVLTIGGRELRVTGSVWFDRQWGLSLFNPLKRWEWFSIRLDDGVDLMLYIIPAETPVGTGQTPGAFGTVIWPDGSAADLSVTADRLRPTRTWRSPATGRVYAVAWDVSIPELDALLHLEAVADDQEIDARRSSLNVYWEGLCDVSGTRGGAAASGHAYVELPNAPAR